MRRREAIATEDKKLRIERLGTVVLACNSITSRAPSNLGDEIITNHEKIMNYLKLLKKISRQKNNSENFTQNDGKRVIIPIRLID